jgi:hypothetical protein
MAAFLTVVQPVGLITASRARPGSFPHRNPAAIGFEIHRPGQTFFLDQPGRRPAWRTSLNGDVQIGHRPGR